MKKYISAVLAAIMLTMMLTSCGKITGNIIDKPTTGALTMPDYEHEIIGRVVRFENDTVMIIPDEGGAIIMTGDMNFTGLNNGDYIRIYCDEIDTSYPAQTVVKEMFLQATGTKEDLPGEELEKLEGMGWKLLSEDE